MVRYEWPCPGNLLHMDVKKLGRFDSPGHAVTGDRRRRSRRVGWEYVHSIVDDCSRLAYAEIHEDERAPAEFMEEHIAVKIRPIRMRHAANVARSARRARRARKR